MKTGLQQQVRLVRDLWAENRGIAHRVKILREWLKDMGYEDEVEPIVIPESAWSTLRRAMMADPNFSSKEIRDVLDGGPDDNPALDRLRAKLDDK